MRDPILVTGIERSGGTLVSKILTIAGAFSGNTTGRNENIKINHTVKEIYRDYLGLQIENQYPLPKTGISVDYDLRTSIENVLKKEGYEGEQWFYKNAAICQTWQMWRKHFPNAKWVIVRRKPTEVVNSCLLTAYMHSYNEENIRTKIGVDNARDGWMWWINEHEEYLKGIILSGADYMEVWPDRMVRGDYKQVYEMLEWLGLKWSPRIVTEIDPLLNKARKDEKHGGRC